MAISNVIHISRLMFRQFNWQKLANNKNNDKEKQKPINLAAISITDPDSSLEPIPDGFSKFQRWSFWDYTYHEDTPGFFNSTMALGIVEFVKELEVDQREWELVCHCEAGISRSAAIAIYVADKNKIVLDWHKAQFANPYVLLLLRIANGFKPYRPFEGRTG